jgi:hypothetical protein
LDRLTPCAYPALRSSPLLGRPFHSRYESSRLRRARLPLPKPGKTLRRGVCAGSVRDAANNEEHVAAGSRAAALRQGAATRDAARGRRTDAFTQRFRTLLNDASKLGLDVLPVPLELPSEGGLSYPIQVVDAPLQLVERELGGVSVSLGFLRTVANALVACVHEPSLARSLVLGSTARDRLA